MTQLRKTIIALALAVTATAAMAQRTATVEGVYRYLVEKNEPQNVAEAKAIEFAMVEALSKEFGTIINSTNYTESDGSKTSFKHVGLNEVKGEWIQDVMKPEINREIDPSTGLMTITARVKFKAREITNEAPPVEAHILRNGTTFRHEDDKFYSGDQVYLYFKAPVDGYLVVYEQGEGDYVYRLLPYSQSDLQSYKIEAEKEYVFFSTDPRHINKGENDRKIDEMIMGTDKFVEWDRFCVIFSPNEFVKASDEAGGEKSGEKLGTDFFKVILPNKLKKENFHKWLGRCRTRDKKMSYTPIDFRIYRRM